MQEETMLRVALYPRVSTDEQVIHGNSLPAQEEALVEFANQKGYKIAGIYRDEGFSARKPALKRKVVQELLADIRAGKIDRVLFTKLDRWFRNVREYHAVQTILDKYNVTWQATLEDYNTATADGRLKVNIMLSVAENEADRTSERIKFVFNAKRQHGEICTGLMSYGYMAEERDGKKYMAKDPETEPIVSDFWERLKKYENIRDAAKYVNEKYGLSRPYNQWYRIAKSEIYTGNHRGVNNYCPAYVSVEDWQHLNDHTKMVKNAQKNRVYLFTGLVKCPSCGWRLSGNSTTNAKGIEYRSYRCNKAISGACPDKYNISEILIERYLLENTRTELLNFISEADVQADKKKASRKKSDATKLEEKLRRLNVIYMGGNIDDADYTEQAAALKKEIAKAKEAEAEDKPVDLSAIKALLDSKFEEVYNLMSQEDKRRMWRTIIKEIKVEDREVKKIIWRV